MARSQRKVPGLLLRGHLWHIDKVLYGRRLCESTGTEKLSEAEQLLARRVVQARRIHLFGESPEHDFREAAVKFLAENPQKRSLDRDRRAIAILDPFIGSLPLQRIHHETLAPYLRARLERGSSPSTINRDLAVVRRILNLAARLWRDETDRPWLPVAPLIQMRRNTNPREPYPLSVAEQRLLFSELEPHLASMALFKVNTGLREQEVVNLRWRWESTIPELGTSIFVIPRDYVKNALDRIVVLNRIARSVIEDCRGKHPEFVFTYKEKPVSGIYNSGWKAARRRAAGRYEQELGLACPQGFRSIRVHDLKHTGGHRLRVAGVSFEDRKLLLGHKAQHITTHYSAPEIGALIAAAEKVCDLQMRASPTISVVRPRS
jgi:integrase